MLITSKSLSVYYGHFSTKKKKKKKKKNTLLQPYFHTIRFKEVKLDMPYQQGFGYTVSPAKELEPHEKQYKKKGGGGVLGITLNNIW